MCCIRQQSYQCAAVTLDTARTGARVLTTWNSDRDVDVQMGSLERTVKLQVRSNSCIIKL